MGHPIPKVANSNLVTFNPGGEVIHPILGELPLFPYMEERRMANFNQSERDAIGIFLTDAYHQKEVKKKMQFLTERFAKNELFIVIDKLVEIGSLTDEDGIYLKKKIEKFYV
jgi:hypothetical protein